MQILQFSTEAAPSGDTTRSRTITADSKCAGYSIGFEDLTANNTGGSKIAYMVGRYSQALCSLSLLCPLEFPYS